jgi:hypothetical protein
LLVAHAFWSPGRGFCFWAEDSRLMGRGRRADDDDFGPRRHSFAVAASGLPGVLGLTPEAAEQSETVRLRLLLPTEGNRPAPTTPVKPGAAGLVVPGNVVALTRRSLRRGPSFDPWLVPVLRVPPGVALELLLSRRSVAGAPERAATESQLASGPGWAWCAALAEEALEMAAG